MSVVGTYLIFVALAWTGSKVAIIASELTRLREHLERAQADRPRDTSP